MADDLDSKILEWLEKHGYPLEMRVAQAFQQAGFEVSCSEYYLDPEKDKPREIDVIAGMSDVFGGVIFQVAFIIECKSSKEKPWICFCPPSSGGRDSQIGFLARQATKEGYHTYH